MMNDLPQFSELCQRLAAVTSAEVETVLSTTGNRRTFDDLCALLSPAADSHLGRMAALSRQRTLQRFGRAIQLHAPLYLSNFCSNGCLYCGFATSNAFRRRCLSYEEAEREADILLSRGFNHILLVAGESEKILGPDYLEEIATRLRARVASLTIEVQPLAAKKYARLFCAGITGVAIYQETYDRRLYDSLHPYGRKKDFDYRLDTPRRVCEAGMREVGIGALLGLADWRSEGLALGWHLKSLRRQYWRTAFTVSFPRLRPAAGAYQPLQPATERDLSQLMFALRIFDPDVGLVLSTREEPSFRDGMLGLAPTRYSAGSCTAPGGCSNPEHAGEQFSVGDHRSLAEISAMIRAKEFDPVCKDWDATFQASPPL